MVCRLDKIRKCFFYSLNRLCCYSRLLEVYNSNRYLCKLQMLLLYHNGTSFCITEFVSVFTAVNACPERSRTFGAVLLNNIYTLLLRTQVKEAYLQSQLLLICYQLFVIYIYLFVRRQLLNVVKEAGQVKPLKFNSLTLHNWRVNKLT